MRTEHSAGAVLYTLQQGAPHYVLVQEMDGRVGLPKGHLEEGETVAQAALREIWEETGVRATLLEATPRWSERYALRTGGDKQVDYFLARFEGQTPAAQPGESAAVLLLPIDEAVRTITFESRKVFLQQAEEIIRQR